MFVKLFAQIFDSSIVENPELRFTFTDLLTLCDAKGVVDMTHEAIARRTNRPIETIRRTITELEAPDPRSRSQKAGGARVARIDDHRDWGWEIVNYEEYRKIASEDQRREKTRTRTRKWRDAHVTHGDAGDAMKKKKEMQKENIYSAYPRHLGKKKALEAIDKALDLVPFDKLLKATQLYAKARASEDVSFTPYPATWFNQERFNDDPVTWRSSKTKILAPAPKKMSEPPEWKQFLAENPKYAEVDPVWSQAQEYIKMDFKKWIQRKS